MDEWTYTGRKIMIASMHGKEDAIGPVIKGLLDSNYEVISGFNTDQFGTFSGEIVRKDPPLETLRKKITAAYELTGEALIIGSEGSFGPHPYMFMVPANEEWVMLKDFVNDVEFIGHHLTVETNHAGEDITNIEELTSFCDRVGFPSHGIILKAGDTILKDPDPENLEQTAALLLQKYGTLNAETDMRADRNPTRMKAIEKAAQQLVSRILSPCPSCGFPGFWITDTVTGLPCRLCGSPTRSILSYIYSCRHCGCMEERPNPDKTTEDPMYCDFCNP